MTTNANGNDNVQPESTGQPENRAGPAKAIHYKIELDESGPICNTDCI